jgi:hypothetical protein
MQSRASAQVAVWGQARAPPQRRLTLAASRRVMPMQLSSPLQSISQRSPAQTTGLRQLKLPEHTRRKLPVAPSDCTEPCPSHEFAPWHATSQERAPEQAIGPWHESLPKQLTVQSRPAGQVMPAAQVRSSKQMSSQSSPGGQTTSPPAMLQGAEPASHRITQASPSQTPPIAVHAGSQSAAAAPLPALLLPAVPLLVAPATPPVPLSCELPPGAPPLPAPTIPSSSAAAPLSDPSPRPDDAGNPVDPAAPSVEPPCAASAIGGRAEFALPAAPELPAPALPVPFEPTSVSGSPVSPAPGVRLSIEQPPTAAHSKSALPAPSIEVLIRAVTRTLLSDPCCSA